MAQQLYNLYNFETLFHKYLLAENVSSPTVRNYLSDLRHFLGWWEFKLKTNQVVIQSEIQIIDYLNPDYVREYKSYLVDNELPLKTVNRRLSTLRKFCSFCIQQGWMKENSAKQISNHKSDLLVDHSSQIINSYKHSLQDKPDLKYPVEQSVQDITEFFTIINS